MAGHDRLPQTRPTQVPLEAFVHMRPGSQVDTNRKYTSRLELERQEKAKRQSRRKWLVGGSVVGLVLGLGTVLTQDNPSNFLSSLSGANKPHKPNMTVASSVDPESYTPPRLECEPIAVVSRNSVTPIAWRLKGLPIADTEDFPDLGKDKITINSCIGNLVDNEDAAAKKKTGIRTFTVPVNDMEFSLDISKYKDGFPDYSSDELVSALKVSNPQASDETLRKAASALTNTIDAYDPARHALHIEALKDEIIGKYGTVLVDAARESGRARFEKDAKEAGLGPNQVWLRFEKGESNTLEFVTEGDEPPDPSSLPFEYLQDQTRSNMTAYVLNRTAQKNDTQETTP